MARKKLKTGDYIPHGYGQPRGGIVVERKSYNDFLTCCTKGEEFQRFQRQLERLEKWTRPVVVVEGHYLMCDVGVYSMRSWKPETLIDRVAGLQAKFNVPIMFCQNRELAQLFALHFIFHSMESISNGDATWNCHRE